MSAGPTLTAVAAVARNGVIGLEGAMPWRLPTDLKRYKAITMGRPMIMGRRTLQSIGRVLEGRDTIVLSRTGETPFEGAIPARTPEEALTLAARSAAARGANEIVIAGGGEVYRLFWDRIHRLEITAVDADPAGDAFFPAYAGGPFERLERTAMARSGHDSADAWFETWMRVSP